MVGFWVIVIGLAIAGMLLAVAYKLQSRAALMGAGGVLLLAALIVVIDYALVTDQERIMKSVYRLAESVSSNDVSGVLAEVSPSAEECRTEVRSEMPQYKFNYLYVRSTEPFKIDYTTSPPTAVVEFRVFVDAQVVSQSLSGRTPWVVELSYRKESDDQWYVYDYDHWSPPELSRKMGRSYTRDDFYRP